MNCNKKDMAWYLKWIGSLLLASGLIIRVLDFTGDYRYYDQVVTLLGSAAWAGVGQIWKDNSIIIAYAPYVIILTISIGAALIHL